MRKVRNFEVEIRHIDLMDVAISFDLILHFRSSNTLKMMLKHLPKFMKYLMMRDISYFPYLEIKICLELGI